MARAPNEKKLKAKELYNKGYKLIDISKELDIPEGTIRSWKNRCNWDNENNATLQKEEKKKRNVANKNITKKKVKKEVIADEIKEVLENTELNDKQRLFCVIYAKRMNATKAYLKAYTCTYETAMVEGCKALRNPKIKEQVDRLTALELNKEFLSRGIIQKYIDIAFSDITDFMKFGKKDEICYDSYGKPILDENGMIKTKEVSYVELKESNQIDGTLISEISEGNVGIKVKLVDKMKALDFLTKHCNLLSDEEKIQLDIEKRKLENRKLSAEISKINGPTDDEVQDDGFIEALEGKAQEDWIDDKEET